MTTTLSISADAVAGSLIAAFDRARPDEAPYRHWTVTEVFPHGLSEVLRRLPFNAPDLGGVSGKRELHNDQRHYFDAVTNSRFPACQAVADAFQSRDVVEAIEAATGADLTDSYVRLEFAQDMGGFWLQPHTDLGVKKFTCLIYLSEGPGHETLGTDIYESPERHFGVSPFKRGAATIFVPGDNTWHGFEKRPIEGVRRSVILNYVTQEWKAREQLSYPDRTVRV